MDRILVVESDPAVQKVLKRLFVTEGFAVEIQSDGEAALESFHAASPSAIISELRLAKLSGRDLCREIKAEEPSVPVIVLSTSSDVSDKVLMLDLGADDYVTKPFSPRELLARLRVALRRTSRLYPMNPVIFDGIVVDSRKIEVTRDSRPVVVTAHEFRTLQFFIQSAGRVITRAELSKKVCHSANRSVDNHILKLRQKLERDPSCPIHFLTVRGVGYRFVC